jgi:hypothetical protein
MKLIVNIILIGILSAGNLYAQEAINVSRLADSIRLAEGNKNYGILKKISGTNYRKACIQTINHQLHNWNGNGDFIRFLSKSYAPIGADNDPHGLNSNWVRNVKWFYNHGGYDEDQSTRKPANRD